MRADQIMQACRIAQQQQRVYIATASSSGIPHLTTASRMECADAGELCVSEWFCPRTIENIQENPLVSLVAYDPQANHGYQLIAQVLAQAPLAVMNGYESDMEQKPPVPQVMRQLRLRVQEVLEFSHGPHADLEP